MRLDMFNDRLEAYTMRAAQLYPGQTTFNRSQLAKISGRSRQTFYNNAWRYPISGKISLKEFVRMELR